MARRAHADIEGVMRKRLRSPYLGLVASLIGFAVGGISYRGSR
jgi:hypothetical protein